MRRFSKLISTIMGISVLAMPLSCLTNCGHSDSEEKTDPITPEGDIEKTVDAQGWATFSFALNQEVKEGELVTVTPSDGIELESYQVEPKDNKIEVKARSTQSSNGAWSVTFNLSFQYTAKDDSVVSTSINNLIIEQSTPQESFVWEFNSTNLTATLIKYNFTHYEVFVPEKVGHGGREFTVTAIADGAFSDCYDITKICIPDTVTSIGSGAFKRCIRLKSVILSKNITAIPDSLFEYCISLDSYEIPSHITSIGKGAFKGCFLMNSVKLHDNITTIPESAFEECTSFTSFEVSDKVTSIGTNAFKDCIYLQKVTIGLNVYSIGENAFNGCEQLSTIDFKTDIKKWTWKSDTEWYIQDISDSTLAAKVLVETTDHILEKGEQHSFQLDRWEDLIEYADKGLDNVKQIYSLNTFIGEKRTVKIDGIDYIVKVIGEEHDTIAKSDKTATFTFQLFNVLTREIGAERWSIWDETSNNDYRSSQLRANLESSKFSSTLDVKWGDSETRDAYAMLTDETGTPALNGKIKQVKKYINTKNTMGKWESHDYFCYLFPLTQTEYNDTTEPAEGKPYAYWSDPKKSRNMNIVGGDVWDYWIATSDTKDDKHSYAIEPPYGAFYSWEVDQINVGVSFAFCI